MEVKTKKKQKGLTDQQLIEKYNTPKSKDFDRIVKNMLGTQSKGALVRSHKTGKK